MTPTPNAMTAPLGDLPAGGASSEYPGNTSA